MLSYLLLHLLFGLAAGGTLRYLRRPGVEISKTRSWIAYGLGIGICLALAAAIGKFPQPERVEESWRIWGGVVLIIAFVIGGFMGQRR